MNKLEEVKLINELVDRHIENKRSYNQINREIREQLNKIGISLSTLLFIAYARNKAR